MTGSMRLPAHQSRYQLNWMKAVEESILAKRDAVSTCQSDGGSAPLR